MFLYRQAIIVSFFILLIGVQQDAFAAGSGVIKLDLADAGPVGKGSAFVGEANRASAVYYNPAGIVQLGTELSVGVTALQPRITAHPSAGNKIQARKNVFLFPHLYFTTPVVQDKFYIGLGENSNWGAGNEWAEDSPATFTRYSMIHNEFENKDFMLVGAYKVNDQLSIAIGADNDDSKIEKRKKLSQANGVDGDSQLKAKDNAWGFRVATLYKVNERHQFGLMYKSPIHHTYKGKQYFGNLNTSSTFGAGVSYQSVFGGTSFETKVTYKLVLPQLVVLGYSYKPTNKWTLNADLEWQDWSSTKHSIISFPDVDATQASILATNNPQSRDWKSTWGGALGAEYAFSDQMRLRGGYVYHQSPIGQDTWDTAFPDANSHSITTGLGYDLSKNLTVDLAYVGSLYETRKINNNVDSGFGANFNGKYKQFANIVTATLTYKF